jgi:hypothetical protein
MYLLKEPGSKKFFESIAADVCGLVNPGRETGFHPILYIKLYKSATQHNKNEFGTVLVQHPV